MVCDLTAACIFITSAYEFLTSVLGSLAKSLALTAEYSNRDTVKPNYSVSCRGPANFHIYSRIIPVNVIELPRLASHRISFFTALSILPSWNFRLVGRDGPAHNRHLFPLPRLHCSLPTTGGARRAGTQVCCRARSSFSDGHWFVYSTSTVILPFLLGNSLSTLHPWLWLTPVPHFLVVVMLWLLFVWWLLFTGLCVTPPCKQQDHAFPQMSPPRVHGHPVSQPMYPRHASITLEG